jgi:glycosyltransferase involved in cell wall biosynthesis
VLGRAHAVTAPTPTAARLLQDNGLHRPVTAISCGIDLSRFTAQPGPGSFRPFGLPDRPTILFVGRLDPDKRVEDLIDALATVRGHLDAQLVIAGTGVQRAELQRRARHTGIGEHVHFLGFVPDQAVPPLYGAADVFCMPGVAELQSLVTLEAMAAGRPIVAADAVALPHLVRHGRNGLRHPPADVPALAAALVTVLSQPALARTMGAASRALATGHDITGSIHAFERLYHDLITAAGPAQTPCGAG